MAAFTAITTSDHIKKVLKTDNKIMADGWYISLGIGDIEPTENTENLINPIFGKNDCSGIVFGQDEYGQYAEIIVPTEILKNYHIKEIGLFNHNDLLISVAKTDINLPEDFNFDVKQRIYIKSIPAYITVEYISKDLYMSNLNEKIGSLNQNKANININNLSETGENKLNTSKMYTTGEVSEDEQGFNQLQQMRHSTFDLSKFTIVGNPTITDDGIASGFSVSNYLKTPINFSNNWAIEIVFKSTDITTRLQPLLQYDGMNRIFLSVSGEVSYFINNISGTFGISVSANTNYKLKIKCENATTYTVTLTNLDTGISVNNTKTIAATLPSGMYLIGSDTSRYLIGSIDLKQFSITVDGIEVFNGNKTGLDVIKPDNYTVVGSPVISEDGVASGFSGSNYLTGTIAGTIPSSGVIKGEIVTTLPETFTNDELLLINPLFGGSFHTRIRHANSLGTYYLQLYAYDGATSGNASLSVQSLMGKKVKISYEISNTLRKITLTDGIITVTNSNSALLNWGSALNCPIRIGQYNNSAYYTSYIDLNAFKIYVYSDLVYQSCLKIPYTESKTGSKIVDVAYRDRVIDLYEQQGLAGYYTIDEENKNFTLPMGEIYGMIESKADKASINGISLPSKTIEVQTVGASGSTYTAPDNGYYCGKCTEGGVVLENKSNNNFGIHSSKTSFAGGKAFLPCLKNDVISFSYDGTSAELTFYYAVGDVESEV